MLLRRDGGGFTLLEILLVVAAIAILASIVIVAVNPNKQLGDSRNAARRVDVTTILNAVYQYSLDNNGNMPATIPAASTEICRATGIVCSNAGLVDLGALTLNEKYLTAIPADPSLPANTSGTGYIISKSVNNRVTVTAPNAEQGNVISVTH